MNFRTATKAQRQAQPFYRPVLAGELREVGGGRCKETYEADVAPYCRAAPVSGDAIQHTIKNIKEHGGSGLAPVCKEPDKSHIQCKVRRSKRIEELEEKKDKSALFELKGQSKHNELPENIIDPLSSLTSEEKAVLQRLRGPLSSKVVFEVLESIKSRSLEPLRAYLELGEQVFQFLAGSWL